MVRYGRQEICPSGNNLGLFLGHIDPWLTNLGGVN